MRKYASQNTIRVCMHIQGHYLLLNTMRLIRIYYMDQL
jgi:hypothetical protein